MTTRTFFLASACSLGLATAAFAQTANSEVGRDTAQQQRIEQGLKSGQLSTGEAAKLERGEARIDKMQSNALKDGTLSQQEKTRIQRAQNQESAKISRLKHNDVTGNPASASSARMQANVQRDVNQQKRIDQGIKNGSLSRKDVGQLEQGQAHLAQREAKAGANGHVGAAEQRRIQQAANRQSKKINQEKHE